MVENVYFYKLNAISAGNSAEQLGTAFIDQVLPEILLMQTNNVVHTGIAVKNLFDESEAYEELISEAGASAADTLPTFNAIGFRLIGDNAAVHDGSKRYAGMNETNATDGVITGTEFLDQLAIVAGILAGGLLVGVDPAFFLPVVVQRILSGGSYRLPENSGEAVISNIIDALFNVQLTSQTSRKIGKGA